MMTERERGMAEESAKVIARVVVVDMMRLKE